MWKAVMFDLDDTLIDRGEAFERYIEDLMDRHSRAFPAQRRAADADTLRALDRRGSCPRVEFCVAVARAFPALALSPEALWRDFQERIALRVRPHEPTTRAVDAVAARCRVAVVTNGGTATQRPKLARAGLAERVGAVFVSSEVGAEKPDGRIFRRALAWAECAPSEALFVGDDPERDIAGAASVGMATCWISRGRAWPQPLPPPDHVLDRVEQIVEVLA